MNLVNSVPHNKSPALGLNTRRGTLYFPLSGCFQSFPYFVSVLLPGGKSVQLFREFNFPSAVTVWSAVPKVLFWTTFVKRLQSDLRASFDARAEKYGWLVNELNQYSTQSILNFKRVPQGKRGVITSRPPCWCPSDWHQLGVSIQSTINLGGTLFRIIGE